MTILLPMRRCFTCPPVTRYLNFLGEQQRSALASFRFITEGGVARICAACSTLRRYFDSGMAEVLRRAPRIGNGAVLPYSW